MESRSCRKRLFVFKDKWCFSARTAFHSNQLKIFTKAIDLFHVLVCLKKYISWTQTFDQMLFSFTKAHLQWCMLKLTSKLDIDHLHVQLHLHAKSTKYTILNLSWFLLRSLFWPLRDRDGNHFENPLINALISGQLISITKSFSFNSYYIFLHITTISEVDNAINARVEIQLPQILLFY